MQKPLIWPPLTCCLIGANRLFYIDVWGKMPQEMQLDTWKVRELAPFQRQKSSSPVAVCEEGEIWVFDNGRDRSEQADLQVTSWSPVIDLAIKQEFSLITSCKGRIFLYIHKYSPSSYAIAVYSISKAHFQLFPFPRHILNPRWFLAVSGELVLFGYKAVWDSAYTERIGGNGGNLVSAGASKGNLLETLRSQGWTGQESGKDADWSDYYYPVRWEGLGFLLRTGKNMEMQLVVLYGDRKRLQFIPLN